jgi:hypothetical protein
MEGPAIDQRMRDAFALIDQGKQVWKELLEIGDDRELVARIESLTMGSGRRDDLEALLFDRVVDHRYAAR